MTVYCVCIFINNYIYEVQVCFQKGNPAMSCSSVLPAESNPEPQIVTLKPELVCHAHACTSLTWIECTCIHIEEGETITLANFIGLSTVY